MSTVFLIATVAVAVFAGLRKYNEHRKNKKLQELLDLEAKVEPYLEDLATKGDAKN
jgi:hypothetical protein